MINPRFVDAAGRILMLDDDDRTIYVSSDAVEDADRALYAAALGGEYGPVAPYTAISPQASDVDRERDRRFGLGAAVDLGDGRTFVADIDNTSKINIMGLLMAGAAAEFRDRDNVTHALSAADVAALAAQAMARVSAIYAASWVLKAIDPTPADYANDEHWPT